MHERNEADNDVCNGEHRLSFCWFELTFVFTMHNCSKLSNKCAEGA